MRKISLVIVAAFSFTLFIGCFKSEPPVPPPAPENSGADKNASKTRFPAPPK